MGTLTPAQRQRRVRHALSVVLLVGLALRVLAVVWDPPLHPDEYFQYLEPAWWHLTGVGAEPWEFRQGVRSWLLPFYNGAWMALLRELGVRSSPAIGWFVKVHWAVINTGLVLLAFRGGASICRRLQNRSAVSSAEREIAGWEGGLLAALACALFPLLVSFAGHTISELPSMLCLLAGLVSSSELIEDDDARSSAAMRKAAWVGFWLALGACLRIANGPLALVGPAWLLLHRRWRQLGVLVATALLPILAFGLVDLVTWGSFAHSFVGYIKFNFIEGKAADFGVEAPDWYLGVIDGRARYALPLLALPALLGLRATWPYLLSALGLVAYLSTQAHKEERFIIAFWPLLLIAAAGATGGLLARLRGSLARDAESTGIERVVDARELHFWRLATSLWLALVLLGSARQLPSSDRWTEQQDRLHAQAWTGAQSDLSALIGDVPFSGGGVWLSAEAPQFVFVPGLLDNPVISHALVRSGSHEEREALSSGFAVVHEVGVYRVLRRR